MHVDGAPGREDRAGRLDREADHDVLAGGDAAEDAAGLVGEERDVTVLHPHLVGIGFAGELGRTHAGADLDALHRVDAHHRLGEIGVQLVVDRIAEAGGNAGRDHLDHGADRRSGLPHFVQHAVP